MTELVDRREMALFSERQPGMQARERSLSERIVSSVVQKIASADGLTLVAERGLDCICCLHLDREEISAT